MTIKKRLARSNIAMFVIPVLAAAVLLLIGVGLALFLLKHVYLPRLGLSMHDLRQAGEQFEQVLSGASTIFGIYAGTVIAALLLAIGLTNFCLTRSLFRHIAQPLDTLTAGVARIRDGDLDTPISYGAADEFKAACDALDEMAARLKASLEEQQAAQQQKQELIAGMSHDLKSPLTSIRAYTEALLDGVAPDEAARQRYLRTIYAKETEIEAMVNRLFAFAKMEASRDPVQLITLPLKNKEYELLLFLMRHPGQVFSREDLYELIWSLESMGDNMTVAVHVNRLREKIEDDSALPQLLQTVWGVGYRLCKGG